jgi:mannose-6-phosphate isomerase-like protein (cupin superfamily)
MSATSTTGMQQAATSPANDLASETTSANNQGSRGTNSLLAAGTGEAVGTGLTLRVDADLLDGALSIHEGVMRPGETVYPHVHEDADQLLYVVEGEVTVAVDGVEFQASAGDFVHKPKGLPHTFSNTTDKPVRVLEITVGDQFQRFTRAAAAVTDPSEFPAVAAEHGLRFDP